MPVVAYEGKGSGGKRMVASRSGPSMKSTKPASANSSHRPLHPLLDYYSTSLPLTLTSPHEPPHRLYAR